MPTALRLARVMNLEELERTLEEQPATSGLVRNLRMLDSAQITAPMPPEVTSAEDVSQLSGRLTDSHGFVSSADGTRLFYRHWPATSPWNDRVVIVLHGI